MKKIAIPWIALLKFCVVLIVPLFSLLVPQPAQAQGAFTPSACSGIAVTATPTKNQFKVGDPDIVFSISSGLAPNVPYNVILYLYPGAATTSQTVTSTATGSLPQDLKLPLPTAGDGKYYQVLLKRTDISNSTVCNMGQIEVIASGAINCKITISQKNNAGNTCSYTGSRSCLDRSRVSINATITMGGKPMDGQTVDVSIGDTFGWQQRTVNAQGGIDPVEFTSLTANKDYKVEISLDKWGFNNVTCNSVPFKVKESCLDSQGKPICSTDTTPIDTDDGVGIIEEERVFQLCTQISNDELEAKCETCYKSEGVWTAVGCVSRKPQSIVKAFLEIGLGLGGGICLLMCLTGGFMLTTSQGDPKQVGEAREMITSAIVGLLFIIFSVFILQFIGVTILNIPGFGT